MDDKEFQNLVKAIVISRVQGETGPIYDTIRERIVREAIAMAQLIDEKLKEPDARHQ